MAFSESEIAFYRLVGARIASARNQRGLSQSELAAAIGTNGPTLSRWESGQYRIKLDDLLSICRILGFPMVYFLGHEVTIDEQIMNEIGALEDADDRQLALALVRTVRASKEKIAALASNGSRNPDALARVRKHHSDQEDPIAGLISSQNLPSDKTITRQIDYSGIKTRLRKPLAGRILTQPPVAYALASG